MNRFKYQIHLVSLTVTMASGVVLVRCLPVDQAVTAFSYRVRQLVSEPKEPTMGQWVILFVAVAATAGAGVYASTLAKRKRADQRSIGPGSNADPGGGSWSVFVTPVIAAGAVGLAACARLEPGWFTALFGPPRVALAEAYRDNPNGPRFDHSLLDQLLQAHVDADGWVDYAGLQTDAGRLDRYLQSVARAPFDQLGRNEKLALLINAYNAFTLRLILDHAPVDSIKAIAEDQRWDAARWQVGGHTWSLNQIEHEQIRPNFREPRIHFALVCAAVGCPPLRAGAFTGDRLDEQLEEQTRYVHRHGTWYRYDPAANTLNLTRLYDWYGGDFEQVAGSVAAFPARYDPPLRVAIDRGQQPRIQWLPYNWDLNSQKNRRPR